MKLLTGIVAASALTLTTLFGCSSLKNIPSSEQNIPSLDQEIPSLDKVQPKSGIEEFLNAKKLFVPIPNGYTEAYNFYGQDFVEAIYELAPDPYKPGRFISTFVGYFERKTKDESNWHRSEWHVKKSDSPLMVFIEAYLEASGE